jgi:hypothetical protein
MAKSRAKLLEREINALIADEMRETGLLVLQEVRLHPCEMDIVLFDPKSLRLAILEIKRTNWRAVLSQAIRAKLFCHFAVAVLPASLREIAPVDEFESRGIGLVFYEEVGDRLNLTVASTPLLSKVINRPFKQLVYRQFQVAYGDLVHA